MLGMKILQLIVIGIPIVYNVESFYLKVLPLTECVKEVIVEGLKLKY